MDHPCWRLAPWWFQNLGTASIEDLAAEARVQPFFIWVWLARFLAACCARRVTYRARHRSDFVGGAVRNDLRPDLAGLPE